MGPHREDLLAYQRLPHDFFMPEKLREELQRKSEASLQTMPSELASGVKYDVSNPFRLTTSNS
jgi:hypothetical protein